MVPKNSVGIVETKYLDLKVPIVLDCGSSLNNVRVAYETYGDLDKARGNAILVIHALTGDAHAAGLHSADDQKSGWWDAMIGPGKAFDTDRFFVICSNCLGGCMGTTGPGSINPDTGEPYGISFPPFTISDMVRLQKCLVDHLGIEKLVTVAGGSMGGMQALEWGVLYPESVQSSIIIASTAYLSAQALAFDAVGRHAIVTDPRWVRGQYYNREIPANGLAIARMLGHITYLSTESMEKKFGREKKRPDSEPENYFSAEFQVESYLNYQGQKFIARFDANSYLYITKAMDNYDLPSRFGTLANAFKKSGDVKYLITSISSDWLFPTWQSHEMVRAMRNRNIDVTFFEINSRYGHDAFLIETETLTKLIKAFLNRVADSGQAAPEARKIEKKLPDNVLIRPDYRVIYNIVREGSRVLDLGCGDGKLLKILSEYKDCAGTGVEINPDMVIRGIEMGIPVVQGNIDVSLSEYSDRAYDYVILNQTLQATHNPERVLKEMVRIGHRAIIGFPNFGSWQIRLKVLLNGAMPISETLPDKWYETKNIHLFTMKDFHNICRTLGVKVLDRFYISGDKIYRTGFLPNLTSDLCIFVLEGF